MFSDFAKKALKQDSRNRFEHFDGDISFIPTVLQAFYENNNPVDVEVKINNAYVRFFSVEELQSLQQEYELGEECFVFASCNGEPIYLKQESVYTCLFGKTGIIEEKVSESFEEYLNKTDSI